MKNFFKCFFLFFSTLISAEIKEHQGILATLYVQDSAEYYANSINVYRSAIDRETAGSVDMDADDHSSPGKPSHEPAQFLISARRGRSWTAKFPSPWAIGLNPDLWLLSDFRGTTSRGSAGIRARTCRYP